MRQQQKHKRSYRNEGADFDAAAATQQSIDRSINDTYRGVVLCQLINQSINDTLHTEV